MENAVKKGMYETDLAYLEDKIVSAAFSWLALNPDVPWSGALEKPSKTVALNEFILPLRLQAKYHYITLFRIQPGSTFLPGSGELVPLYPCVGCTVTDGEFSHALNFGKKLHLLADKTSHRVFNVGATAMYAMWLFRTEKDFATFRKAFANMKAAADIKAAAGNEAAT